MSNAANTYDEAAADHQAQVRIAEETEARLMANPEVQAWLAQFAYNASGFVEDYIQDKVRVLEFGAKHGAYYEARALKPQERAYRRLWEIQQKKLFNLQCEWRAGRLELPEITSAGDFTRWSYYIHECRLIEPITDDELDLYLAYLASDDCVDLTDRNWLRTMAWQDFLNFRRYLAATDLADEGGPDERHFSERYPEWYEYYDRYRGTGYLMRLPVVRAEHGYWFAPIPEFVAALFKKAALPLPDAAAPELSTAPHTPADHESPETSETPIAATPPVPPAPRLPHLPLYDKAMTWRLLQLVEPPEVLRYWQVLENQTAADPATERAHEAIEQLQSVQHPVPIAPAATWQEAVYNAWVQNQKRELAEQLRVVYAEYCLREELNIAHPAPAEL